MENSTALPEVNDRQHSSRPFTHSHSAGNNYFVLSLFGGVMPWLGMLSPSGHRMPNGRDIFAEEMQRNVRTLVWWHCGMVAFESGGRVFRDRGKPQKAFCGLGNKGEHGSQNGS